MGQTPIKINLIIIIIVIIVILIIIIVIIVILIDILGRITIDLKRKLRRCAFQSYFV